jgi:hypothetical protein
LGYSDPRKLIADLKEGSIPKVATTPIETKKEPTIDVAPNTIIELR